MKTYQKILLILIVIIAIVLRFNKLSTNPPGLYWDEAAFGYDAYAVLKSAHDHHGHFMPLLFESFGDWKLPVYHYLLVPAIAIFGLNELAIRFPSALFSTFTIIIFYLLVKKLTKDTNLSLFAASFLSISPWHIQFSRGGFESTVGLFFVVSGLFLFLHALDSKFKKLLFCASFLLFTLSMYTYHAYRIFTPPLVLFLAIIYKEQIKKFLKILVIPLALALIISLPLFKLTFSAQGTTRAASQTAFKIQELESARLDFDQKSKKPFRSLSKYLYQKPVYYSYIAAKGYLDHFSPIFLFFKGDQIGRHSQVDMGQIYLFDAILLVAAFFAFKFTNLNKIMLAWLILAPIPAIIVSPTPHAYRTLQMAIPLSYFSALGAYQIIKMRKFPILKILLGIFVAYWFIFYLHLLFVHYPKKFAPDWQDGYKQMVQKIQKYQGGYDKVYVTDINQVPYIYLLFFEKYDPQTFVGEKGTRDHFDKYFFIGKDVNVYNKGRILYVAPSWEKVDGQWLGAVDDSAGRHLYSLWEIGDKN